MVPCMQCDSQIAMGGERGDAERGRVELNRLARSPSRRRGDSRTRAHLPGLSGVCLHLLRVESDTVAPLHQVPPAPARRPPPFLSSKRAGSVGRTSFVHARCWAPYAGAAVDW